MPCQHVLANGIPCKMPTKAGAEFCFAHDPGRAEERRRASSRGGRARKRPELTLPPEPPDLPLKTTGDVVVLLGATINLTLKGRLESRVANAVGLLSGVLMKALQESELADQLADLRRELEELKHNG